MAGILSSPKGYGVELGITDSENSFLSFQLCSDLYGVLDSRTSKPGIVANFSKYFFILERKHDFSSFVLYAGPGLSAGWVYDFEGGLADFKDSTPLRRNPGLMAAISGGLGCLFMFKKDVAIRAGFRTLIGCHARKDENFNNINLSYYTNGLYETFMPEIAVSIRF